MSLLTEMPVISLDLETGGLIPNKHTPLSIGAVVLDHGHDVTDKNSFYIQLEWDTLVVDPRALRINQLDIANPPGLDGSFTNLSMPGTDGIKCFSEWLRRHTDKPIRALGMNVGSFDLPMLRSIWPDDGTLKWPFHYRSVDLNSLFFALSRIQNKSFDVIKNQITEIAWERSEFDNKMEHHALADAWSNVYVWEECLRRLEGDCEISC